MKFLKEENIINKKVSKTDYEREAKLSCESFLIKSFNLLKCCSEGNSPMGRDDCSFD